MRFKTSKIQKFESFMKKRAFEAKLKIFLYVSKILFLDLKKHNKNLSEITFQSLFTLFFDTCKN